MIDWNDCLPTKEMQADFERFKELKTTEEKEAFKKESPKGSLQKSI